MMKLTNRRTKNDVILSVIMIIRVSFSIQRCSRLPDAMDVITINKLHRPPACCHEQKSHAMFQTYPATKYHDQQAPPTTSQQPVAKSKRVMQYMFQTSPANKYHHQQAPPTPSQQPVATSKRVMQCSRLPQPINTTINKLRRPPANSLLPRAKDLGFIDVPGLFLHPPTTNYLHPPCHKSTPHEVTACSQCQMK
ncbi:uncharacterized protein [Apostichopus japonicus]|uniref:uncharacterized protein n=1 Tax=Stichopus japonicus TaxID=307972 RepID=UPI003AB7D9F0